MAKKIHGMSAMFEGAHYTPEEVEFMFAVQRYKELNQRSFPAWSEVLHVAVSLGYCKVANPQPMPRFPVE